MLSNLAKRCRAIWNRRGRRQAAARGQARPTLEVLEERAVPTLWFVSSFSGFDGPANGLSPQAPLRSIQAAVNRAASGDAIAVTGGLYTFNPAQERFSFQQGLTSVVEVFDKKLAIVGGFDLAFQAQDLAHTPSIIDGSGSGTPAVRGVFVVGSAPGAAGLLLDGFTVQNGVGLPQPALGGFDPGLAINGYGGGLLARLSDLGLCNDVFQNNFAVGANSPGQAGVGAGGGVGIFSAPDPAVLDTVLFTGNVAVGGNGMFPGSGQGGGLATDLSAVMGSNLTFQGNTALGGTTTVTPPGTQGSGGAGLGGAMDLERITAASTLTNLTVTSNQAQGGSLPGGVGLGGEGMGGGIEDGNGFAPLTIIGAFIQGNTARGGNGVPSESGGNSGRGGGIDVSNADLAIGASSLLDNTAEGGAGFGGAVADDRTSGVPHSFLLGNSTVARNSAQSTILGPHGFIAADGAGGLELFNVTARLGGSVFDGNTQTIASSPAGQAIDYAAFRPATLTLTGSVIVNHQNTFMPPAPAVAVSPGSIAVLSGNSFAGNTQDTGGGGIFIFR
jgi:hypothetical protein